MQIRSIVLYSHDGQMRSLDFKPGELNIITGRRGTGKSAIIRIIEYCLGSSEIKIPEGKIREHVSWYGLSLVFQDTSEMFIARAEPKPGARSSSKIYVDIGTNMVPPPASKLVQNTNPPALVGLLSSRLGIANIETQRSAKSTQLPYKITIDHALFFSFQRQDEIAKPTLLFHRQDEQFVESHIKDVLPYFLGAMGEDRLGLMFRLRQERMELKKLERDLLAEPAAGDDPRAAGLLEEAIAVGLVPRTSRIAIKPIDLLRDLDVDAEPTLDIGSIESEIERRRNERDELLARQRMIRNRADSLRELNREQVDYVGELDSQRARLKSVGLLKPNGEALCPVCHQSVASQIPSYLAISGAISTLDEQLSRLSSSHPKIEGTISKLEADSSTLRQELQSNQATINQLESRTEKMRAYRDAFAASAVVRGRIGFFLENSSVAESQSDVLRGKIEALKRSIQEFEDELSLDNVDSKMESMLRFVEDDMTSWARELDLEYKEHVRLDPSRLTVVVDTKHGPLPLERMGSGANWMGYHVVTYAALHHWFEQQDRPVPRFVVFDQPTQVFYPPDSDDPTDFLSDDDRNKVRELFHFLSELPAKLDRKVQIIVTDHADLDTPEFQEAIRANWHQADALIPASWIK
jgi:energy-coupling factor transporter ATP-binding protein EcfA2/prefoldin subunit 5